VLIKEAIVTIGPQAFMAAEKLPDKIKGRLPCSSNLPNAHGTPHCGKRLRANGLSDNLIVHRKFPFGSIQVTEAAGRQSFRRAANGNQGTKDCASPA
jgi:hypothetical protein